MRSTFYSPMKRAMIAILGVSLDLCLACTLLFAAGGGRWLYACAITFGVVA